MLPYHLVCLPQKSEMIRKRLDIYKYIHIRTQWFVVARGLAIQWCHNSPPPCLVSSSGGSSPKFSGHVAHHSRGFALWHRIRCDDSTGVLISDNSQCFSAIYDCIPDDSSLTVSQCRYQILSFTAHVFCMVSISSEINHWARLACCVVPTIIIFIIIVRISPLLSRTKAEL